MFGTRFIFFLLVLFCNCTNIFAQPTAGTIKGRLLDSLNNQPLSFATVTVFRAKDTSLITYRLSDGKGDFKVAGLPFNERLRVVISFSEYRVFRNEFELSNANPVTDMGVILLTNDTKPLDEVLVYAERPPVVMKKDTIEFNASAFKTLPNALLEDLLKKLPGVEIDMDGNIRVKGKRVDRVMVDGKEFFGGEPQIATGNLPANIVDKVQVMDDKEQIERNPDIAPANVGQVINIKLKKSIKQGWFGKAYAGAGNNKRYEAGGMINTFRDITQVSLLANSNNINKPVSGISELQRIGGYGRAGISDIGSYAGSANSYNSPGNQHSFGGGINFSQEFSKKLKFNLEYFYGHITNENKSVSNIQRFFGDTTQVVARNNIYNSNNRNNRIAGNITWKIDSFTTITFRPALTLNKINSGSNAYSLISDNNRGNLNDEFNNQTGNAKNNNYNHNIFLLKNFRKKGRMFTITQNFYNNNSLDDQYYTITTNDYIGNSSVNSSQLRQRESGYSSNSVYATFFEPVSKKFSFRLQHAADVSKENNFLHPYNRNTFTGEFTDLIDSINTSLKRKQWKNISSAGIDFHNKKITFTSSINTAWLSYNNIYQKNTILTRKYFYVYPSLSINWKNINLNYSSNINAPSSADLQPIIDNTNRQFIYYGNPDLKPAFTKDLTLNYYTYNPNGSSFNIYFTGQKRNNEVIRENTVDISGIQTSRPVNVSGLKSLTTSVSYTRLIKFNKEVHLSVGPSVSAGYNQTIVIYNGNRSNANNTNLNGTINFIFNYSDKIELNSRYGVNLSRSKYEEQKYFRNVDVITHSLQSELVVRYPENIVWQNRINYFRMPYVGAGIKNVTAKWNAAVTYLFLKNDRGQLKLSVSDILNHNVSVSRTVSENYISDYQTTTLPRYFMLSFIYNFHSFNNPANK